MFFAWHLGSHELFGPFASHKAALTYVRTHRGVYIIQPAAKCYAYELENLRKPLP